MTYEEALHSYRIMAYMLPLSVSERVVEALEKQIPKKPIILEHQKIGLYYRCPICDEYVEIPYCDYDSIELDYCGHCGQAIDWSE